MNESQTPKAIFFWTLVVLFWLTAGAIIGYAFGYRFNFKSGIFVYAGSITLKTTPQEVDVFVDGILMPSKSFNRLNNSYHIGGVRPGNYLLEVKAPGYQSWSKKISVHSGISTEFWNVVLSQDSYAREDYESAGIQKFFISPRKNLAAFSQQVENMFFVKIFNPGTLEMTQVFAADDYTFTTDDKENIEWSPEAHRIIIPAVKDGQKNYFIASLDNSQAEVNLKDLTGDNNLSHCRWDPKNKDVLFYMSDDKLYRLDLNDLTTKKLAAENIASYDLSPKALFYFQLPEGIVYKTNFATTDTPEQITTSGPANMNDSSYQIIVYDEDRIVFLNQSHNLFIYNKGEEATYFRELSGNATGSQFSDDGKKLLFWNNREVSAYFVRKWEVQPTRNEDELMSITKFSDTIGNVQWTRDYEHVLFTNNNKVKLIEIDNRDHRNMMDVLSLNDNTAILVNNFTDSKLYYTEKNEQGQNSLHAIYFPERTTFFQSLFPAGTNTAVQN
jgi:dipeptidyl aminopeptidase/acylaminoacyl peptidase